ncbi:hypothetical protein [Thermococcus sp.]|uniref:hypothetical protein n=1 Tax=Thermococcus sp. TaxID=35749 RepID=UPI00261EB1A2|nr:hypothetical protein [Thermococcus sp.]
MIDLVIGALVESAFGTLATAVIEQKIEHKTPSNHVPSQEVIEVHKIKEFWGTKVKPGERIRIAGTISPYVPMMLGPPKLKMDLHREYRRHIPKEDYESLKTVVDAYLAFTAGQMVWRIPMDESPWMALGLYQCIVRNSALLLVDKEYYEKTVEKYFIKAANPLAIDAEVVGTVSHIPNTLVHSLLEKFKIPARKIRPELLDTKILVVDGKDTKIKYTGKPRYLDGDIWVAVEYEGEEFFVTRFLDLTDIEDMRDETEALKRDVERYIPRGNIIFQFDQVDPILPMYQRVSLDELKRRFIGI